MPLPRRFPAPLQRLVDAGSAFFGQLLTRSGWGIRGKLIAIFIVIKVVPLVLLAGFAWMQADRLGELLAASTQRLTQTADRSVAEIGQLATADSMKALDNRMREEIERLTTDTARHIAAFLHQRDGDIRYAGTLEPDEQAYRRFLSARSGAITVHGRWQLAADGKSWQPAEAPEADVPQITATLPDNEREFHYRPPDSRIGRQERPLYVEMTFVGLDGREKIKMSNSRRLSHELRDVSRRENTYCRAENYFAELRRLKAGEIFVSEVIGAYVGSPIIGHYTPEAAKKAGIPYEPEKAAYAGRENPVGKRFEGIVRWATPVVRAGRIIGYVTLALDHDHLMEFTNTLLPTAGRYTDIPDAASGNYAFIWDHRGRSIAHPRHHSIVGYRPDTGEPEVPWLETSIDDAWRQSGKPYAQFIAAVTPFDRQSYQKKQSERLRKEGRVGLDCRYVNAAPQCTGWFNLTRLGGSGSFLIFWSGLWKITTAAAIPYHTGQYAASPRGFGFVTIGANVDEFYRPANETKARIDSMVTATDRELAKLAAAADANIRDNLATTAARLAVSTIVMSLIVIAVAIWMASYLTRRIRVLIDGIARFRQGEHGFRLKSGKRDEMGELANSFDAMADTIGKTLADLRREIQEHKTTGEELRAMHAHLEQLVAERTAELSAANTRLRDEIDERRNAEELARHLAQHDPLTSLANRRHFQDQLQKALQRSRRTGKANAVLYFDLDRFKQVNDTLGHETGDSLLKFVADTLLSHVRETDVVARLGGDEFAVLLNDVEYPADCVRVANALLAKLNRPVVLLGNTVCVGTSIGIAFSHGGEETAEDLVRQADLAMYQAKQSGGNAYQFFVQEMHERVRQREALERELAHALTAGELLLHYQGRYARGSIEPVGVEALLRWQHPRLGLLLPEHFISLAESTGKLPAIDAWVLNRACRQAAQWQSSGHQRLRVAVNITSRYAAASQFVSDCLAALEKHRLAPTQLDIEISERALIDHPEAVAQNLGALRQRGVRVTLDDFGVQQSSLQRLVDCPVDILKIDRYFVHRLHNHRTRAIVEALMALSRTIGVEVVAEGIETDEQKNYLYSQGCLVLQGFLFNPPLPADAFAATFGAAPPGSEHTSKEKTT